MTAAVVGALAAGAYLGFLGWDQNKDVAPDGHVSGPYQPWQVVGLGAVVLVVGAVASWRRHPFCALFVMPVVLTVCFSVDAANDVDNDGLWGVGAFMLLIGSGTGLLALTSAVIAVRARKDGRPGPLSLAWRQLNRPL